MSIKAKIVGALGLNVLIWLAMWIVFAGLMFCAAGAYMALAERFDPVQAALLVGGGLITIVAIIALIALLAAKSGKKPSEAKSLRQNPDNVLEHQLRPLVGDKATDWAKRNTGVAIVGALSAGVLLAASPGMRRILTRAALPMATRKAMQAFQQFSDN